MNIEKTAWGGWPNCYRLSNGEVELVVTSDVGPRVMRYAFSGGPNPFLELTDELGKAGEAEFKPRGGIAFGALQSAFRSHGRRTTDRWSAAAGREYDRVDRAG